MILLFEAFAFLCALGIFCGVMVRLQLTYFETDSGNTRMLSHTKLILASASPRRQELLREAGIEFEVFPANIPEERNPGEPPLDYALRMAQEKAFKVAATFPNHCVLGADTIVIVDDEVLGKPRGCEGGARS